MIRRTKVEIIVVVVVVMLAMVAGVLLYAGRTKIEKGQILTSELTQIRAAVNLYKAMNTSFPPSLEVLTTASYTAGDGTIQPYAQLLPALEKGVLVDPFGTPYAYDASKGWVSSATKGYEFW